MLLDQRQTTQVLLSCSRTMTMCVDGGGVQPPPPLFHTPIHCVPSTRPVRLVLGLGPSAL
jgi:hypothetical protein